MLKQQLQVWCLQLLQPGVSLAFCLGAGVDGASALVASSSPEDRLGRCFGLQPTFNINGRVGAIPSAGVSWLRPKVSISLSTVAVDKTITMRNIVDKYVWLILAVWHLFWVRVSHGFPIARFRHQHFPRRASAWASTSRSTRCPWRFRRGFVGRWQGHRKLPRLEQKWIETEKLGNELYLSIYTLSQILIESW